MPASTKQSLKRGQSLAEKLAEIRRYCGGQGGKPGPCADSNSQPNKTTDKTSNWLALAKKVPAAALAKAKTVVQSKYAALEKRYGRKYAIAIIGAGLAATPIPVPGSGLLAAAPIVAIAELHRRLSGSHGEAPSLGQGVPADDQKMKQLGREFIKSLQGQEGNPFSEGLRKLHKFFGVGTSAIGMAEAFAESATLPDQEIFTTGTFRGKDYNHEDLDQVADNFKRTQAMNDPKVIAAWVRQNKYAGGNAGKVSVPAVIGHEENQEFLDRSDLPAAGWASSVRNHKFKCPTCKGTREVGGDAGPSRCPQCVGTGIASSLRADFQDVPRQVSRLLKRKAYRTVSAEIYDRPPDGVPGQGKMLRRVAFLGGEIPQVKTLEDLNDLYEHAEDLHSAPATRLVLHHAHQPWKKRNRTWWTCFAELKPMDRDAMLEKLTKEYGFSPEALKDAADPVLAEILRVYDSKTTVEEEGEGADAGEELGGTHAGAPELNKPAPDGSGPARHQGPQLENGPKGQELAEGEDGLPEPKDEEERKRMAEYAEKAYRKYCGMGESQEPAGAAAAGEPRQPKKVTMSHVFSEQKVRDIVKQEVGKAVASAIQGETKGAIQTFQKFMEDEKTAQKTKTVQAILDDWNRQGKVAPAEIEMFREQLMAANTSELQKFSETVKGKTQTISMTQFDRLKSHVDRRPTKFAERMRDPAVQRNNAQGEDDEQIQEIREHFEMFKENFPKNTTVETLIEGYKANKKQDKDLTVKKFLAA